MITFIFSSRERTRFFRFAVVGAIGAVVDFGTFNILTRLLRIQPVLGSVFSFTAAVLSNFIWNRYWTYPDSRSKPILRQVLEFAIISILGLAIRTPLFAFLEKPLPIYFASLRLPTSIQLDPLFLGHNTALAIAVIAVMFWNFF